MKLKILRRDFLKQGAFAAAAVVVPARVGMAWLNAQSGLGRTSTPRKVVILGAGLAGLSAGYELTRAGHDVKVLEAQERPGGRVLTLRTFEEGQYGDAGAARIPDNHEWTLRYVKEFNLPLLPFYPDVGVFAKLRRGRREEVGWEEFADAVEHTIGITLGETKGWHKIEGGNDHLPRAFAEKLAGKVVYGAVVSRVEQTAAGARVTFKRAGTGETLAADYVVCAIHFAVLGRVEFAPRLSEQKMRVRDELTYELAARAFMQTRERFWERARWNGFAVSDLPAEFWPSTFGQPGRRGVLQAYVRHHTATEWAKKNEAERLDAALTLTEQAVPGVRASYERGAVKCWGEDQWAGCAWTHPSGPQLVAVNAPEGRIHFAGEHASVYASWMNGALESGNRAARAVEEAARREAKV
ncbi:MAG: monoamine oxidase [Acidobacteriota bacterium]|jgi:monoamine oxidase|nr:monoamine oxidase [Acidobacteriota bacterium]